MKDSSVDPTNRNIVGCTGAHFIKLHMMARNRRPVTLWKDSNAAFYEIANDIRETLKELRKSSSINLPLSSTQTQSELVSSPTPNPPASLLAPVWNVPYPRNLRFTDREEILQQLHESFTRDTASSLKQPLALVGLGGMGKTQIALEYAYRYREEYHVVLWVKADSPEVLTSELASFATLLKVPGKQKQDQQYALAAFKYWLEVQASWLLILDNIEDLKLAHEYLPATTRGHILLTTNSQVMYGVARRLDIDKMDPEHGAFLLLLRFALLNP